jgi:hypothetical protein
MRRDWLLAAGISSGGRQITEGKGRFIMVTIAEEARNMPVEILHPNLPSSSKNSVLLRR